MVRNVLNRMPMVFSASPLFLSHVSYFFSQATSISVKWIFRCLLYLMSELYTCLTESIYPRLFSSWRSRRYSLNASSTVFGLTELEICSFKVLAVNNLSSDFSLTISVSYSFFLLAMSMLICSLLGQFDFGTFFSKFPMFRFYRHAKTDILLFAILADTNHKRMFTITKSFWLVTQYINRCSHIDFRFNSWFNSDSEKRLKLWKNGVIYKEKSSYFN